MDEDDPLTAIVLQAALGDQAAWNDLVVRYAPLVMSVTRRYRLQRDDAEDVSQTLWLRLVEHLGDLREPRAIPMWIITTTRNECLRLLQTRQRTRPVDFQVEVGLPEPTDDVDLDAQLDRVERHQALLAAFAGLPAHQRELLQMLLVDPPLPYAEISRRLGVPIGSLGPTRARALRRLRESPPISAYLGTMDETGSVGGGHDEVAAVG